MLKYLFRIHNYPRYIVDILIIGCLKAIWQRKKIQIGKKTKFLSIPIITKYNNSNIIIGENCLICSRSSQTALGVSHKTIIRTLKPTSFLFIGNNVRMSGTTICCASNIQIGDNCVIGSDVIISDTDFHSLEPNLRNSNDDFLNAKDSSVSIGKNVFIGTKSIILKGIIIGDNVVIGAGSVVTKSFNSNSIIAGNPAKIIGYLR